MLSVKLIDKVQASNNIFYLKLEKPLAFTFTPGQFARLGIKTRNCENEKIIWRAQTIISSPKSNFLEFYLIFIKNQPFSELVKLKNVGDSISLDSQSYGFFTIGRFQISGDLWLLATGTGIAPYLSILTDEKIWQKFKKITILHIIRNQSQCIYFDRIRYLLNLEFSSKNINKFSYIPIFTREENEAISYLNGEKRNLKFPGKKLVDLLKSGHIQEKINCKFSIENSKFMLCGNPDMIKDTRNYLKSLGFLSSRKNKPAQITVENYW